MTRATHTTGVVPPLTVGMRCLMARVFADLEQTELAELTGLSRKTIGNYEKGRVSPRRAGLVAIAMATGVDLGWLENGNTPDGDPVGGGVVRHQGLEPRTRWFAPTSLLACAELACA